MRADKDIIRSQARNTSYEESIESLEADNERLRAEIERLILTNKGLRFHMIDPLRADNERLRAALRNIIRGYGGECGCYETASAALEGKP